MGMLPYFPGNRRAADSVQASRLPAPVARGWRSIAIHLPPPNFIILHYAYFIGVCLVSSVIFWGSSTPARSVSYTDSLFLVVSAMTLAGLNTVNLSQINTFQQFMLFLLIMLGSAILVSIVVVHIRRKAFERRFTYVLEQKRGRSNFMRRMSFSRSRTREAPGENAAAIRGTAMAPEEGSNEKENGISASGDGPVDLHTFVASENSETAKKGEDESVAAPSSTEKSTTRELADAQPLSVDTGVFRRITFASTTSPTRQRHHSPIFSMQGVGARGDLLNHPQRSRSRSNEMPRISEDDQPAGEAEPHSGFAFLSSGFVGRNSQFSNLTLAEREKLGGVEYRAVSILAVVVPVYFVLWQLLGCIGLGAYVANNRLEAAETNGENPW